MPDLSERPGIFAAITIRPIISLDRKKSWRELPAVRLEVLDVLGPPAVEQTLELFGLWLELIEPDLEQGPIINAMLDEGEYHAFAANENERCKGASKLSIGTRTFAKGGRMGGNLLCKIM